MTTVPQATTQAIHEFVWTVPVDHPAFAGHFPGQPLLPGVTVLSEVMERVACVPGLSTRLGPSPLLSNAKFLAPVVPGSVLRVLLTEEATQLRFEVRREAALVAQGRWVWWCPPALASASGAAT